MIDVIGFALTFLLAWNGRDKTWTPTFEGTREERFISAMLHYKDKMGIEDDLIFATSPHQKHCSSVALSGQWQATIVSWHVDPKHPERQLAGCQRAKPEFWALHEACHIRYQHHRIAAFGASPGEPATREAREAEVKECMIAYSKKERR